MTAHSPSAKTKMTARDFSAATKEWEGTHSVFSQSCSAIIRINGVGVINAGER